MPLWIVGLVLLAAFLHASWNALVKGGDNKLFEIALVSIGSGLIAAGFLPFLPPPDKAAWPLLALSSLIHFIYHLGVPLAYSRVDLSYGYTLMRGCAPMFTALALTLMGTPLHPFGWLGVALLCFGVLALAWDSFAAGRANITGTLISLGTALVIMCYTLSDGYGARASNHPISYTCWIFFINMFPITLYVFVRYRSKFIAYAACHTKTTLLSGLCNMGAYGIALWAMTQAPIALVAALRETSVIWGMLLGVLFLKETFTLPRCVAIIMVLAGTIVIRLS